MVLPLLMLSASALACSMDGYRAQADLVAANAPDGPTIEWRGDRDDRLRMRFTIRDGTPVIARLDMRKDGGDWVNLLRDARPEYHVDTGLRRLSKQQIAPLRDMGVPITQDIVNRYRWDPFWDAPLDLSPTSGRGRYAAMPPPMEGIAGTDQSGLPRRPEEIGHASARFAATGCAIRTQGARIVISFPGVTLGSFAGSLEFTLFKGTNLIRQEVLAVTERPWVAYKFAAGLKSDGGASATKAIWRDTANQWQAQALDGPATGQPVPLASANRILAVEQGGAALSIFPEPHRFFWARETAINMRYSWYRTDGQDGFAIGIRQNDHEDESEDPANWALYSARPGTVQHMPMFLYPSLSGARSNIDAALAFTHGDRYQPLDGYKVMAHHYHMEMGRRIVAAGGPHEKLPDLVALKALGIDIVSPVDAIVLQGFGPKTAPMAGPDPLSVIAASVTAARLHSDRDFLIMPSQEIFAGPLGGHSDILFSHPVYWDQRQAGQALTERTDRGTVYHLGSAEDIMTMAERENAIISMPHPRTKGSTGYPEAIFDRPFFRNPRYDSMGMRWGMGLDGSERRLCDYRCWPLMDELSNWAVARQVPLKHILGISEVMTVAPGDDIYASQPVNYVKLAKLPGPQDASSVIDALRAGNSFWTTGEILLGNLALSGVAGGLSVGADLSWTYPLDFIEIVWGDGKTVQRKVIDATDLPPMGSRHITFPLTDRRARWVRIAAWDVAANGAVSQPIALPGRAVRR